MHFLVFASWHHMQDAPSRDNPIRAEWMHWMVTNIQAGDMSSGTEVVPYNGPTPPPGTGKHRCDCTLKRDAVFCKMLGVSLGTWNIMRFHCR